MSLLRRIKDDMLVEGTTPKYIPFNGKKYIFNLDALKKVCLTSSMENPGREVEITNVYEPNGDGDYIIASKVEHETKINKTQQNDMIVYDFVKMLITILLDNDMTEDTFKNTFGVVLSLNTLINWGILEEINE